MLGACLVVLARVESSCDLILETAFVRLGFEHAQVFMPAPTLQ